MANNAYGMSADQTGSISAGPMNPNIIGGGNMGQPNQPQIDLSQYVDRVTYEKLQQKLGEQGSELGELRGFYESIGPLLSKLDENPEVVDAILSGQIDSALVKSITDGTLSPQGAQAVTQAHEEVKQELGSQGYSNADPDKLARMIEERTIEIRREMEGKFREADEIRGFEAEVNDFIANTPDFEEYAGSINSWLDSHPDVTDIQVAYYAVKGQALEDENRKNSVLSQAEYAKRMAMNAGGGGSQMGGFPEGVNAADALIGGTSNPNNIF